MTQEAKLWTLGSPVFLSSRVDETGNARRAAFSAIIDARLKPIAFEVQTAAKDNRTKNGRPARREADRRQMDRLLHTSEYFVGIYDQTLGLPEPEWSGLRAIEYEFLRFIIQWKIRDTKARDQEKELGSFFHHKPENIHRIPDKLYDEVDTINHQLDALRRAHEERCLREGLGQNAPLTQSDLEAALANGGGDYSRVFFNRIRLFVRSRLGDSAISTSLIRALRDKPVSEFHSIPYDQSQHSRPVTHTPALSMLYADVYQWLSGLEAGRTGKSKQGDEDEDPALFVRMDIETPGSHPLLLLLSAIRSEGLDVYRVDIGSIHGNPAIICRVQTHDINGTKTERIKHTTSALTKTILDVFYNYGDRELSDRLQIVEWKKHDNPLARIGFNHYTAPRADGLFDSDHGASLDLQPTSRDVTSHVANVPGILSLIVDRIHALRGEVTGVVLDDQYEKDEVRSEIQSSYHHEVHFTYPRRHQTTIYVFLRWPKRLRIPSAERQLAAELRFLQGIYDVRIGAVTASRPLVEEPSLRQKRGDGGHRGESEASA